MHSSFLQLAGRELSLYKTNNVFLVLYMLIWAILWINVDFQYTEFSMFYKVLEKLIWILDSDGWVLVDLGIELISTRLTSSNHYSFPFYIDIAHQGTAINLQILPDYVKSHNFPLWPSSNKAIRNEILVFWFLTVLVLKTSVYYKH